MFTDLFFAGMMGHPQAATAAAQMQYQPRHMMQTRPPPNQQKPLPLQVGITCIKYLKILFLKI